MYFEILDCDKKGYLDEESINKYTKEIAEKVSTKEQVITNISITQLIFDSIQPTDSKKYEHFKNIKFRICVEDFLKSKKAGLLLGVITNHHVFEEIIQVDEPA